jgi:maltooligosyltrehalose trehalohydrolase
MLLSAMTPAVGKKMNGATISGTQTEFRVWAPAARQVMLRLTPRSGGEQSLAMTREQDGTFALQTTAATGDRYSYIVDGSQPLPDPVSRYLPEGVHGPTEIVDPKSFTWTDNSWHGLALDDYLIYELHVGTFTAEGTFDAVIDRLDYLKNGLGISAIELMPVAAFPGTRNWGYDGVSPYAVQNSYGGPEGLKRLVDAAHGCGIAVILDVVYNHLGNEGNYLRQFGPYFTARHMTPWGEAFNYDGPGSEGVRQYIVGNACYWIREYHIDALRLDAVQTIHDDSSQHILAEIQQNLQQLGQELGRTLCCIAETDENDARITRPADRGGYGLDAVWSDDFHHTLHAFFTGERKGYYQDFGRPDQIVKALNEGFVFQGETFKFWGRARGTPSDGMPLPAHIISIQNHDQVGNRALGERLTELVPRGVRRLMAALLMLAPQTPLLFMGQEYDEPAPFQFFTSYGDAQLQKAVSEGRRNEFKDFDWSEVPDPEDPKTFERSRLNWDVALQGDNFMLKWYRELIALRKRVVLACEHTCRTKLHNDVLVMKVPAGNPQLMVMAGLKSGAKASAPLADEGWRELLHSDDDGYEVTVYERV